MPRRKLPEGKWVPTAQAAGELGISPRRLRELKADLCPGIHYLIASRRNAGRASYLWSVEAIETFLASPMEGR